MNDVIRLLPDSVANQIAAGEVIQRPMAVIKELVENAVDAGATDIRITVRDGGRTLIQVTDNGCGMTETDARLAFERHATSKIRSANDLFALHTMGFRGEALPSISAIARVELRTRTADSRIGTRIVIEGSKVESQEPCICEKGADFQVKNLFFNVPARRRFLSSDATELSHIVREFERMALANPDIRFSLDTGSRNIMLRSGTLLKRIGELWKNNLNMQLIPVEIDLPIVKILGYISRPEYARRRNALQYLLVNGRNMKHPGFRAEILSCYDNLIARDTQPNFFMTFTVDPATIDVNISPTKQEIKFQDEREIRNILGSAVKSALAQNAAMPAIDFDSQPLPVNQPMPGVEPHQPSLGINPDYNPFRDTSRRAYGSSGKQFGTYHPSQRPTKGWEECYRGFLEGAEEIAPQESPRLEGLEAQASDNSVPPMCIQCGPRYIATSTVQGLMIIDAYRAQVRVLYEKFLKEAEGKLPSVQKLMFAEEIELDEAQREALKEVDEEIKRQGIILDYLQGSTWQITALPPAFDGKDARDVILQILDTVIDEEASGVSGTARRVALAMARSAATRSGRNLTEAEMEHLVSELLQLENNTLTPDGKTITVILQGRQLSGLFG